MVPAAGALSQVRASAGAEAHTGISPTPCQTRVQNHVAPSGDGIAGPPTPPRKRGRPPYPLKQRDKYFMPLRAGLRPFCYGCGPETERRALFFYRHLYALCTWCAVRIRTNFQWGPPPSPPRRTG